MGMASEISAALSRLLSQRRPEIKITVRPSRALLVGSLVPPLLAELSKIPEVPEDRIRILLRIALEKKNTPLRQAATASLAALAREFSARTTITVAGYNALGLAIKSGLDDFPQLQTVATAFQEEGAKMVRTFESLPAAVGTVVKADLEEILK